MDNYEEVADLAPGESVAEEVIEAEFNRWAEGMDLDLDISKMDDEDKKSLSQAKDKVFRSMGRGHLIVTEVGDMEFQPQGTGRAGDDPGKAIMFREPRGASYMAGDKKKKGHDVAKMYATMGDMTGQPPVRFARMAERDLKICLAIVMLFLG